MQGPHSMLKVCSSNQAFERVVDGVPLLNKLDCG